jgi:hypothetical protein
MDRFTLSRAAHAAEVSPDTLARWLDNSVIRMRGNDVDSTSSGVPRRFSIARIMQIAATQALVRLGISPARAAGAAATWTDQATPGIEPAGTFVEGGTWLLLDSDGARVTNLAADVALTDSLRSAPAAAAAMLDLRRLRARVLDRLEPLPEKSMPPAFLQYETKAAQ